MYLVAPATRQIAGAIARPERIWHFAAPFGTQRVAQRAARQRVGPSLPAVREGSIEHNGRPAVDCIVIERRRGLKGHWDGTVPCCHRIHSNFFVFFVSGWFNITAGLAASPNSLTRTPQFIAP